MRGVFKIFFFAFFIFLFSVSVLTAAEVNGQRMAPDFELQDSRQEIVKLSSYKDKQPLLLLFWTILCQLCQEELRILNDSYASLVRDGLEVLAINVGEHPAMVQAFVKRHHLPYPTLVDRDTSVAISYQLIGVPTYVLIDKKGAIVFQDHYFPSEEYKDLVLDK